MYASVARLAVLKFVHYMNASADVLALASVEVPINNIPEGGCIVIKYVALSLSLPASRTTARSRAVELRQCAIYCEDGGHGCRDGVLAC